MYRQDGKHNGEFGPHFRGNDQKAYRDAQHDAVGYGPHFLPEANKFDLSVNKSEFYDAFLNIGEKDLNTPFQNVKRLVDNVYNSLPETISGDLNVAFNTNFRKFYECYREVLLFRELNIYESEFKSNFHETLNKFMEALKSEKNLAIKNFIISTCGEICNQVSDVYNYGLDEPRFDIVELYLDYAEKFNKIKYSSNDSSSLVNNTKRIEALYNELLKI